ncbi:MAG TPA: efflux RND transporter periplasmic adaptor subunit [Myxococcota bacterium]|nr:efflux RND transporter periplasmic adaptor subunit [Myxococcota bacterium]
MSDRGPESSDDALRPLLPELVRVPGVRGLHAIALLVVLALLALVGLRALQTPRTSYRTESAKQGDLVVTVTATGPLQPTEQVDVGSELSGTLRTVAVSYNDHVQAGQVLARLDTTRLEAQALQARASLASAEASLDEARATEKEASAQQDRLQRLREISNAKLPSESEFATARSVATRALGAVRSAEAAVEQARATLDVAQTDLSRAEIRSPIDGVVLVANARPGQTVAASLQAPVLFTLAGDLTKLHLDLSVDEADVGKVHEGQSVHFNVDAWPVRTFDGKIEQVHFGARTQAGVVSYAAIAAVENPELLLRPGMTATAEIEVEHDAQVMLVPNAALRFEPPEREASSAHGLAWFVPDKHRFDVSPSDAARDGAPHVWELQGGNLRRVAVEPIGSDGTWTGVRPGTVEDGAHLVVDTARRG